ncbi:MAG: hypothetical protein M9962_12295 [Oligoflexia bacterium]|nr:hypothetical protein [Oligoflexia bacterium]
MVKRPPSAEKIFEVVKHSNYSFTDFITCLVPTKIQIEELKELIDKLDETQKSILSKPWLIGLLSLIETILAENCQNLEEELSKRLYIDKRISRKIIDDLKKEKFFNWNKIEKKYELDVMQKPLNLAANRELLVESIAFWNEYALKVANKTQVNVENKNRAAFITFSVAEEDIPKLHELFSIAFHKINELCKNKKGKKVFTLTSLLAEIDGKYFGEVLK